MTAAFTEWEPVYGPPTLEQFEATAPHWRHRRGYIGQSRTLPKVRRYCCDNCGGHHWGEYVVQRIPGEANEVDFDYQHPDGSPYTCRAGRHILYGGPERCMGACWPCQREAAA